MSGHVFAGARQMKPTQRHRPAIWENMLGTVYAQSPQGEVRYFHYDWAAAREFAQVDQPGADPRLAKATAARSRGPRKGQMVLWVNVKSLEEA